MRGSPWCEHSEVSLTASGNCTPADGTCRLNWPSLNSTTKKQSLQLCLRVHVAVCCHAHKPALSLVPAGVIFREAKAPTAEGSTPASEAPAEAARRRMEEAMLKVRDKRAGFTPEESGP